MKTKQNDLVYRDVDTSKLLDQLQNERDSDRRADIIRILGGFPEPEVIKTLWDLRNNLEKEDDPFVQYETKLSLHKVTTQKILTTIDINFFLDNLEVFQSKENDCSQVPKVLIDADLIEEFLLRNETILNRDSTKVMGLVLEGKINPYIGKMGLINIWHSVKSLKSQEYANRLIIELLSKIKVGQVDLKEIDLEKYPNVNLKTAIQVEIARKYNLAGIITIRDREFIASGYPFVGSPSLFLQSLGGDTSPVSIENTLKNLGKISIENEKAKLNLLLENEPQRNLYVQDHFSLFKDWKIEQFGVLSANNSLTFATVILSHETSKERYTKSAFKQGPVDALLTAFDEALSHLVEIKHTLKSIYVAHLEAGKEAAVTVKAVVECGDKKQNSIYTHENINKAYFFAYVKAVIAIYAPDEYISDENSAKELTVLYKIGERDFDGLNFSKVDLSDTEDNLSDTKLMRCNFSNANLSGVNLTNADLTGADLSHANLSNADLTGANLTDVKLDESNETLLDGTILTNTIMHGIKIEVSGESRLQKVAQLLEQIDLPSQYQILAIHSMTDSIWWHTPSGQEFFEAQKKWIQKGMIIKRVFILPQNPESAHLQVLQEQQKSGIEVYYICHDSAKNIDQYDCHDLNLLICENHNPSLERNTFTTQMFINELEKKGYISYKLEDIKTNKQRFSFILGKTELFDGNKALCALSEFSIKNKKAFFV